MIQSREMLNNKQVFFISNTSLMKFMHSGQNVQNCSFVCHWLLNVQFKVFYLMYGLSLRKTYTVILVKIRDTVTFRKKCSARWFFFSENSGEMFTLSWQIFMLVNIFGLYG